LGWTDPSGSICQTLLPSLMTTALVLAIWAGSMKSTIKVMVRTVYRVEPSPSPGNSLPV